MRIGAISGKYLLARFIVRRTDPWVYVMAVSSRSKRSHISTRSRSTFLPQRLTDAGVCGFTVFENTCEDPEGVAAGAARPQDMAAAMIENDIIAFFISYSIFVIPSPTGCRTTNAFLISLY